jgi:hypothetical protein
MFIGSPGDRFSYRVAELGGSFNYVTLLVICYATKLEIEKIKYMKNYRLHTFSGWCF